MVTEVHRQRLTGYRPSRFTLDFGHFVYFWRMTVSAESPYGPFPVFNLRPKW